MGNFPALGIGISLIARVLLLRVAALRSFVVRVLRVLRRDLLAGTLHTPLLRVPIHIIGARLLLVADVLLRRRMLLGGSGSGSLGGDLELADLVFGQAGVIGVLMAVVLLLLLVRGVRWTAACVLVEHASVTVAVGGMEIYAIWKGWELALGGQQAVLQVDDVVP